MPTLKENIQTFQKNYQNRLGESEVLRIKNDSEIAQQFQIKSAKLRDDNYPTIFYHGRKTKDVIILTHGLSDSPFYMKAVGRKFYEAGLNVIFPLLPAHGLKEPDQAMEDNKLNEKWQDEMDKAVALAQGFGKRISVGGFSTGGALSYNYILRHPKNIQGGLFLFSGAIAVRLIKDASRFISLQKITKMRDGRIFGIGRDPYKYPTFPKFGALELGDIIRQNVKLSKGKKITQPVFAAHSVHDDSANVQGILDLLTNYCEDGLAFLVSANVTHSELPLDKDLSLDMTQTRGPKIAPKANPQFDLMMENALRFFKNKIGSKR